MRPPVIRIQHDELVIDNFAGGGGASTGIEAALDRPVDIAINHSPQAIVMHKVNHPETKHYCENIWEVDPKAACGNRKVGLAWFSPDCTHFSRARGGKPCSKEIRCLAWVVLRWARAVKPRVIILENVQEFETWGPLLEDNRPDKSRKGETFRAWLSQLTAFGYTIEFRSLVAADYGSPTIRKRLFLIARRDRGPVIWPEETHGEGRAGDWKSAATIVDWRLGCPSIFTRKRPLADATMRRIALGVQRYVIDSADPFIISHYGQSVGRSVHSPLPTVTAGGGGHQGLVVPTLVQTSYGERKGQAPRVLDLHKPLTTVVAGGQKHGLIAAFLNRHNAGPHGGAVGKSVRAPVCTITARDSQALTTAQLTRVDQSKQVRAFLLKYYGKSSAQGLDEPLHTTTSKARFGLVTVAGEQYAISDIGMRMLQPHELFAAQGFPSEYIIDPEFNGKPMTKTAQIKLAGNSVCPQVASALVAANTGVAAPKTIRMRRLFADECEVCGAVTSSVDCTQCGWPFAEQEAS